MTKTTLTKQEKTWILERRFTRLTDKKEVLIYPMGAERYLSSVLFGNQKTEYPINKDIENKHILVIPGYGNTAFLFAESGAKSVTVCDKDPVTIAWVKAFKKYYHYRQYTPEGKPYPSISELLAALTCWYPPLLTLPSGAVKNTICWAILPKALRRTYLFYILALVTEAIESDTKEDFELDKHITFYAGEINHLVENKQIFDTAYVPYLLGVTNGIEAEREITHFIKQIIQVVPEGPVLVTPTLNTKEFRVMGKRYFVTTPYSNIKEIPGLKPYFVCEDRNWFKTQGLAVFRQSKIV